MKEDTTCRKAKKKKDEKSSVINPDMSIKKCASGHLKSHLQFFLPGFDSREKCYFQANRYMHGK